MTIEKGESGNDGIKKCSEQKNKLFKKEELVWFQEKQPKLEDVTDTAVNFVRANRGFFNFAHI